MYFNKDAIAMCDAIIVSDETLRDVLQQGCHSYVHGHHT